MGYDCHITEGCIITEEKEKLFELIEKKYDFSVYEVSSNEFDVFDCERFRYHEEDFEELAEISKNGTYLNFIGEDNEVWSLHLHDGIIEDRSGKITYDASELDTISIPLDNGYVLEASKNADSDYKEIYIYLKKDGLVTQDLAIVGEQYGFDSKNGEVIPIHGIYSVSVYADPANENYTDKFTFGRYEENS